MFMTISISIMLLKNLKMIKNKFNLTLFISLFIILFSFSILTQIVKSCHLENPKTYYQYCEGNAYECKIGSSIQAYDWYPDLGSCDAGIRVANLFEPQPYGNGCRCFEPLTRWKPFSQASFFDNGAICKVKWGANCEGEFEGKFDYSERKCVQCEGKVQVKAVSCGESNEFRMCESACGADDVCDEISPSATVSANNKICSYFATLMDSNGNEIISDYCLAVRCDSTTECYKYIARGYTHYCFYDSYDNTFKWSFPLVRPLPSKETSCSDGYDNDCDGLRDCADPDCNCTMINLRTICYNGQKMICLPNLKCVSINRGDITYWCDGSMWTTFRPNDCDKNKCSSNSDCEPGYCCVTKDIDPNNEGKCVPKGIYSNNPKWLCDPPELNSNQNVSTSQTKSRNFFDLILNIFSSFFNN